MVVCGLMIYCNAFAYSNLHQRYKNRLIDFSVAVSKYSAGIFGSILFLPIINLIMFIFECDNAIGNNLPDSYLSKDCFTFCWKDSHLAKAILSIILIITYIASYLFSYERLESFMVSGNYRMNRDYFLMKSILQLILILTNKILAYYEEYIHGIVFVLIIPVYITFLFRIEAYNDRHLNMWLLLIMIAVFWNSMVGLMFDLISFPDGPLWISILIIGWSFIIISGLLFKMKIPNFIHFHEGMDLTLIFRFAFTQKVTAEEINMLKRGKRQEMYQVQNESEIVLF